MPKLQALGHEATDSVFRHGLGLPGCDAACYCRDVFWIWMHDIYNNNIGLH